MKYAVAVQQTETLDFSLMGPFDTEWEAEMTRDMFVEEMDSRDDFTAVYSVWVVPMRTVGTEVTALRTMFDLYTRTMPDARTLDTPYALDGEDPWD